MSESYHLGWGTLTCGLEIVMYVALDPMNINEQVSNVIS